MNNTLLPITAFEARAAGESRISLQQIKELNEAVTTAIAFGVRSFEAAGTDFLFTYGECPGRWLENLGYTVDFYDGENAIVSW